MGVQGLWPLLEPVGRRVNIEALTNKRLAVGVSQSQLSVFADFRNFSILHKAFDLPRCRRFHMARPIHQGDAEREGRDVAQCASPRILS